MSHHKTRALVVIDVQESYRAGESWAQMHNQAIAEPVSALVDAARACGDLVVWVLHAEPGSGGEFDPAGGLVRLFDELRPQADEPLLTKTSVNVFTTTNLQQQLVSRGIDEVVVCGIRTEQCCESTARLAADLGYAVTFVTDATTTSGVGDLSAQEIISRTEQILAGREFATIATTEEWVAAAGAAA